MLDVVALVTCSGLPDLDPDDRPLVAELARVGISAIPTVWSDTSVDWGRFDAAVLRSTWDYHENRSAFLGWAREQPRLINAADVVEWNSDKRYLQELANSGLPIVPTIWLETMTDVNMGLEVTAPQVVIKPAVSAGSRNTMRYANHARDSMRAHAQRLISAGHTVMVQPYLTSVDVNGETALIYIGGVFSHAIRKGPILSLEGEPAAALYAAEHISIRQPASDERELAEAVLDRLRWKRTDLAYARVDVVRDRGRADRAVVIP